MKKYYDIPEERLACMIDWSKGGSLEDAKKYLENDNIREISKKRA